MHYNKLETKITNEEFSEVIFFVSASKDECLFQIYNKNNKYHIQSHHKMKNTDVRKNN